MDTREFDDLEAIMGRLADRDEAAVVTLYERFGGHITGTVRSVLRDRGWSLVRDDVDGLVFDACQAIAQVAGSWSPEGGALPWNWARHRVAGCVDRLLGQRTVPLDDHLHVIEAQGFEGGHDGERDKAGHDDPRRDDPGGGDPGGGDPGAGDGRSGDRPLSRALAALVEIDARCGLLQDAFAAAQVSPVDREMCLEYAAEQHSGNRSPAKTVGALFALKEPTVRQRVRRVRGRLRRLAAADLRFAPLSQLPLLR